MNALNAFQSIRTWLAQIHRLEVHEKIFLDEEQYEMCITVPWPVRTKIFPFEHTRSQRKTRVEIVQEERFSNEGQYEMCIIVPPPIRTKIFSFYANQEPKLDENDISLQRTEFSCVALLVWSCSQRNTKVELKLAEKQDIKNQGVIRQLTVLEALNAFPTHNIPAEWISCPLLL